MARHFVAASSQYLANMGGSPVSVTLPFTFSCWYKPTNVGTTGQKVLMALDDGVTQSNLYMVYSVDSTGACSAGAVHSGAGNASATVGVASNGVWFHHAGVFLSTSSRTAYLSGIAGPIDTTLVVPTGFVNVTIGAAYQGAQMLANGDIAETAMWNVALTAVEIAALAAGVAPRRIRPQNLVFYAPLRGYSSPEIELVKHLDLTLGNAPTVAIHPRIFQSTTDFIPSIHIYKIAGTTKNTGGVLLAGVTVRIFRTSDNVLVTTVVSDSGGNFSATVIGGVQYYAVAMLPGTPNIVGTTVNTLVGV